MSKYFNMRRQTLTWFCRFFYSKGVIIILKQEVVNKNIIVVDVMIIKDNKVLLYYKIRDNAYELPGGYVINGMDMLESLKYHVKNQVNIDLDIEKIQFSHLMHYPDKDKLYVILKTDTFYGDIKNNIPQDYKDVRWFEIDKLPSELHFKLQKSFNEIKEGVFYSKYVKK